MPSLISARFTGAGGDVLVKTLSAVSTTPMTAAAITVAIVADQIGLCEIRAQLLRR
jgi:hypothetical protein